MFSLASGCFQWLMSKDELKILIIGLDYAGKTTLLEQVKRAYIPQYRGSALEGLPPTIGMNLARISTQRVDVTLWDVGGSMHAIWDRYYSDADGVVFVIDSTDRGRFERARRTMFAVLSHPALADIPLLVLANKCDVRGAATTTEIHDGICRADGSPLGGAGGGAGAGAGAASAAPASTGGGPPASVVLTSGGATAASSSSGASLGGPSPGGGGGGGGGSGGRAPSGKREYRVFTCAALTGDGVREATDWMIAIAKRHMYAQARET